MSSTDLSRTLYQDSITQAAFSEGGTGSALADLYVRALDVQNRGLGGYTTKWAIPIAKQVSPMRPELCHYLLDHMYALRRLRLELTDPTPSAVAAPSWRGSSKDGSHDYLVWSK